tara:strand:+ start:1671 stop:2021 length:351 start_codon:yes stop_codon:yes gene_type:complete
MNLKAKICALLTVLFASTVSSQYYKEKISVVLFKADFVEQISLKEYKEHNTHVFDFENAKHEEYFIDELIEFLPTIILYNNGKEMYRVEAGITLKMPENYRSKLKKEIEQLIENKF